LTPAKGVNLFHDNLIIIFCSFFDNDTQWGLSLAEIGEEFEALKK
jgi:hypothetical protein